MTDVDVVDGVSLFRTLFEAGSINPFATVSV